MKPPLDHPSSFRASATKSVSEKLEDNPSCGYFPDAKHCTVRHPTGKHPPFEISTVLKIECDLGYVRSQSTESPRCVRGQDHDTAVWRPAHVACAPVSCGGPPELSNGRFVGTLYTFPNEVRVECNPGYVLDGLSKYRCAVGGEWIPRSISRARCVPARCPEIEAWDEETRTDSEGTPVGRIVRLPGPGGLNVPGTTAEYHCKDGYRVADPHVKTLRFATRTCALDGSWHGDVPRCEKVSCPELPLHLRVENRRDTSKGSIQTILCESGRKYRVICKWDGTWSGERPFCAEDEDRPEEKRGGSDIPPDRTRSDGSNADDGKRVPAVEKGPKANPRPSKEKKKTETEHDLHFYGTICFIVFFFCMAFYRTVGYYLQT